MTNKQEKNISRIRAFAYDPRLHWVYDFYHENYPDVPFQFVYELTAENETQEIIEDSQFHEQCTFISNTSRRIIEAMGYDFESLRGYFLEQARVDRDYLIVLSEDPVDSADEGEVHVWALESTEDETIKRLLYAGMVRDLAKYYLTLGKIFESLEIYPEAEFLVLMMADAHRRLYEVDFKKSKLEVDKMGGRTRIIPLFRRILRRMDKDPDVAIENP